tara:strand:+ start:15313 stop:17547 length:2235 start_codon:yes stop_codon:yes gene_type:complete
MNFLKIYTILLIINFIPRISSACGGVGLWGPFDEVKFSFLFDPSLVLSSKTDYLVYNNNYNGYYINDENNWTDNLDSWAVFLENKYEISDLKSTIYRDFPFQTFLIELQNLRKKQKKNIDIDDKEESFINYLKLALDVENLLYENYDSWNYYNNVDTSKINDIVELLQLSIKHEKFNFLKERYAYQLIKLFRYNKKYHAAREVYKSYFLNKNSKSFISYWAMDQYAGILRKLGDLTSSNYYFLKVIINSPSKRISAFTSFNITTQEEFDKTENMCSTNKEKIFLYYLRANNRMSLILHEMENVLNTKVFNIDDNLLKHDILKILMTRQINFIDPFSLKDQTNKDYIYKLILFNKKMIKLKKQDVFWELSLSYLYYLNNQLNESEYVLHSMNNLTKEQGLQRNIIKNLLFLKSKDKFNDADEEYLGNLLFTIQDKFDAYKPKNAYYQLHILLKSEISKKSTNQLYKNVFDNGGAGLNPVNYLYYSDLDIINRHLFNINNTKNSALKDYVLKKNYVNIILERKGTLLMRKPENLEQAINIFEMLPDDFRNNYKRFLVNDNPFTVKIKDCIHGYYSNKERRWVPCDDTLDFKWSKLTLSMELLKIRNKAYEDNNPHDYFLLASAYYNMSYFGSSWNAVSHYRPDSFSQNSFIDMQIPLSFYKKVIKLSNDDELIAQSLFMSAKCERNKFIIENNISWSSKKYNREIILSGHRSNFYELQKYKSTNFYKQSIKECSDFSYYSNNYFNK